MPPFISDHSLLEKKVLRGPWYCWDGSEGGVPGEPVWCREVDILLACTATRLPPTPGVMSGEEGGVEERGRGVERSQEEGRRRGKEYLFSKLLIHNHPVCSFSSVGQNCLFNI